MSSAPTEADAAAQRLVQRYFAQLTKGCRRPTGCYNAACSNCKNGPGPLDPTAAALAALRLAQAQVHGPFCDPDVTYLDMDLLRHVEGLHSGNVAREQALETLVRQAFGNVDSLMASFQTLPEPLGQPEWDGDMGERVEDNGEAALAASWGASLGDRPVDWGQVRDFWRVACGPGSRLCELALEAAAALLEAGAGLRRGSGDPGTWRMCAILLSCPTLVEPQHHETVLGPTYAIIAALAPKEQAALSRAWSALPASELQHFVRCCQEYTIIQTYEALPMPDPPDEAVCSAVLALDAMHAASLASAAALPLAAFYNDAINEQMVTTDSVMRADFRRWRARAGFSFCEHAFVLDAASKQAVLKLDAVIQMHNEFENAVIQSVFTRGAPSPFLVLRVRRGHLVRDTLHQISSRASDLKKPLKVHMAGEEGVDEGGVQKEFFQLITRQLFDPDYGMWLQDDRSGTFWFNKASLESSLQFELIGVLLGIAIYNGIILDARFPNVVYKKLMHQPVGFEDLRDAFPDLARGLQQLVDYGGDARDLALTFAITEEVYGEKQVVPLVEGGAEREVDDSCRQEYVDRYVEHVLTTSVAPQFDAFARGFHRVCGGPALDLFHWQELELLVCGSPDFDFVALERGATYEDGFGKDHHTIRLFWEVVHGLEQEYKRKLLIFTTGSDRVPIRGLSNLRFVISRNGSDESRLPSAHTCFNHLLLPEYTSAETLRQCLLTAIRECEGFHIV